MRILVIDNSIAFTGAFKCALNEAELLSPNHSFVFILPSNSTLIPLLKEKGIPVYEIPMLEIKKSIVAIIKYPFALLSNTFRIKHIIRDEKIDVVQMNDFYNLLGASAKIFGSKIKLLTYVRFLPNAIPGPLRKLWTSIASRYADTIIAVSDTVLEQLPQNNKSVRIYDPANLKEALPAKVHEDKATIQLLYLSNYIQGKGHDYALDAFIHAYKQNNNLRLKFVGGDMGLEKNRQFKEMLQNKVNTEGLNKDVTFAPFSSNVEEEIKNADIVLNFSDSESFSMTCLEAAYYGTAVIATRCGGPEEIIADKKTGLLVSKRDIAGMTDAILTLSNNKNLRQQYADAGKTYVRNKFSTANFITQFENIIK
ncbi:MAG: glycosyltransferase family 4 protein [Bacteroidetes bacterium]|nr:glycosyltransferase family 4 protein [Bacteroidota bacterium]